jgi:membrane associated rhomboid family serine protease
MPGSSHAIREELHGVLLFVGSIWAVYVLSLAFPGLDRFGLVPRRLGGLIGIGTMPFLHGNLQHILSNTVPLVILLLLLAGSRAESWRVVVLIAVLGGALLWLFGRTAVHIGASGLISGLATFLIFSGFLERRIIPLMIALLVGFFYGGSLIAGILPRIGSDVSWDGHLWGAVAGAVVAYSLTRDAQPRRAASPAPGREEWPAQ